jgi:hypothetical protein
MRSWISALACLLVAGCAGQPASLLPRVDDRAARQEVERQNAIFLVDFRDKLIHATTVYAAIARANADQCPRTAYVHTGLLTASVADFRADQRDAARRIFGTAALESEADGPFVYWVLPDSPAERAGIQVGDRIVGLGGSPVGEGSRANERLGSLLRQLGAGGRAVHFTVQRGAVSLGIDLMPEQTCDYGIEVRRSDRINAFADGAGVAITTGMLRFATADDELALVLGHELAHNTLKHRAAMVQNSVTGGLLGATGALLATGPVGAVIGVGLAIQGATLGAEANSQDFESEADYIGAYFAARAGYDVDNAADLLRRFAVLDPGAIDLRGTSHPSTALRFLALEQTGAEIRDKRQTGAPMLPNPRQGVR